MPFVGGEEIMIFVSGVHGVGKSYFCNLVKEVTAIKTHSSSPLIAEKKAIKICER